MFLPFIRRPHEMGAPRARLLCALLALGTAAFAAAPSPARAQVAQPCVGPAEKQICGVATSATVSGAPVDVSAFLGIRYATAPRWQNPSLQGWTPGAATAPGSICPQGGPRKTRAGKDTLAVQGAEDCLFLNVWRPAAATGALPVMVFIHGGAFIIGSGSAGLYDGAYLAASGNVVVVTLNYRLGALGFLATTAIRDQRIDGNFGLLDQRTALQWVRSNIAQFGGDPGQVTVFGESAGAMSVGMHLFAMPGSTPLFRAAIMESNPMGFRYPEKALAQRNGARFVDHLCSAAGGRRCPRSASWAADVALDSVILAQSRFEAWTPLRLLGGGLSEGLPWVPVVDGTLVTGQPVQGYAAGMPPKPYIFGTNRDEGALFAAGAKDKAGRLLGTFTYRLLLDAVFGFHDAARITRAADTLHTSPPSIRYPYEAHDHAAGTGLSATAAALSEMLTDFLFDCANLASADAARAQSRAAAPAPPIYAYHFEQPPFFAAYDTIAACLPGSDANVCHGDELPYVFNTFAHVDSVTVADSIRIAGGGLLVPKPTAADSALAVRMGAAWTSFARGQAPLGQDWAPYTGGAGATVHRFGGPANGQALTDLSSSAKCTQLWYTIPPLNGSARRSTARAVDPAHLARSVAAARRD